MLDAFHQRCLRRILDVHWSDRRTNVSILQEANLLSVEAMVMQHQLLPCTGHVKRMTDEGLPKQILYGELSG